MTTKHTLTLTYEQLSALDDAVQFVDMARDEGGIDVRPYREVRAKVRVLYERATAKQEAADMSLIEGKDYRLIEVKKANELKQWGGGTTVVLTIGDERFQAEVVRKGRGWDVDFAIIEDGKRTDRIVWYRAHAPGSDQFDDDQWVDKIEKVEFIVNAEELKL